MANKRKNKATWTDADEKRGYRILGVLLTKEEFEYMYDIAEINNDSMSTVARDIFLHSRSNTLNYSYESIKAEAAELVKAASKLTEKIERLESLLEEKSSKQVPK